MQDSIVEDNNEIEEDAAVEADSSKNKKLLIIYILEILQKYSDKNHLLTQADIIGYIKQDYDMDSRTQSHIAQSESAD
jgi:hypothetical protein